MYPTTAALVDELATLRAARVICRQRGALEHLATYTVRAAIVAGVELPAVGIRPRGSGRGGVLEVGHVGHGGRAGWSVSSGTAQMDDDVAAIIATVPAEPGSRDELRAAVTATAAITDAWSAELAELGLTPRMSAGSTAAQLLPSRWRRAARKLGGCDLWRELRGAYYGGRVECRRPSWSGDAVEYDIRSAYGAALAGYWEHVPDWKTYDREPWPREPGWYDVTVRASSPDAPLPRRSSSPGGGLLWPRDGETWRGWYTRPELELEGVEVLSVHRVVAGRYSDDLRAPVERLLAARDASACEWRRAIIRGLVVALAGKLAQVRTDWRVWIPSPAPPPPGVLCIGHPRSGLWVYPVRIDEPSATYVPTTASYIAALPRCQLYRELRRAGSSAIYCDTDSLHVDAGTAPPLDCGEKWGQWTEKARGAAYYQSARHYTIGTKRVQL